MSPGLRFTENQSNGTRRLPRVRAANILRREDPFGTAVNTFELTGAGGGGRTLMPSEGRGILSPAQANIAGNRWLSYNEIREYNGDGEQANYPRFGHRMGTA
jgi:hypothetical protein